MPSVSTNTTAFTKTEYPPVFDGSKTIRPRPRKVSLPPQVNRLNTAPAPSNNLEFSPTQPGFSTLQDLLEEAGESADVDAMHVNTFERLMRTTNHKLLAMQPEAVQRKPQTKVSPRCKAFLAVHHEECTSLSRADFTKSCRADEVFSSLSGFFDFWNKFVAAVESRLTVEIMRRKLRLRYGAC